MKINFTPEQAKQIIEGYSNLAKSAIGMGEEEIEKMAARRMAICLNCPEISKNKERCTKCGCVLSAKTRSETSACPLDKWKKNET